MSIFGRHRITDPVEGHAEIIQANRPNEGRTAGNRRPQGKPAEDYEQRIDELNAQYRAATITYEEMADGVRRALGA